MEEDILAVKLISLIYAIISIRINLFVNLLGSFFQVDGFDIVSFSVTLLPLSFFFVCICYVWHVLHVFTHCMEFPKGQFRYSFFSL